MYKLRDYQQRLVDEAHKQSLDPSAFPCVTAPTGSGKTVCLSELARLARGRGERVLLMAHRREIIAQLIKSAGNHLGEQIGVITAGHCTPLRNVNVAMVQTLARRPKVIEALQGCAFLGDELHHISSKSYKGVIERLNPVRRLGATATPISPSGEGLGKHGVTSLVIGPQAGELMNMGNLARYKLYGVIGDSEIDTSGVKVRGGEYATDELQERVVAVNGSVIKEYERLNPNREPTITVTVTVDHAYELANIYRDAGYTAEVVVGSTPADVRKSAFDRFAARELNVLVSVALIDEGIDIADATCLQLLRPTRSLRLWRQLTGRVLRPAPGKTHAIIIDQGSTWQHLPLPCEDIHWTLEGKLKAPVQPRELNEDSEVIEKPAPLKVEENRFQLTEIDPAYVLGMRLVKRHSKFRSCLAGVRKGILPKTGLWKYANNPAGLSETDKAILEDILNVPKGYCNQQPLALV